MYEPSVLTHSSPDVHGDNSHSSISVFIISMLSSFHLLDINDTLPFKRKISTIQYQCIQTNLMIASLLVNNIIPLKQRGKVYEACVTWALISDEHFNKNWYWVLPPSFVSGLTCAMWGMIGMAPIPWWAWSGLADVTPKGINAAFYPSTTSVKPLWTFINIWQNITKNT